MSDWVRVCAINEIQPGQCRVLDVDGAQVAVVNVEGAFHAIEDVCTHDGGQLTGGAICGHEIECPRHGARFDLRTGAALCAPAYEATAVFPIRIEDGVVWVRDDRWD
ncbi:MAG: non-heme iron oxygenase ferredoxin subunit [Rhodanobacteraceae bacterium]|nr:non-heme iron oxygenase ferredoxin subunit [Rhodanobacteraceae bacterium]